MRVIMNIVLFLASVGCIIAQHHGEGQHIGYDSSLPLRGSLTGATFVGGKGVISHGGGGRRKTHPAVNYVTPPSTNYGEPVGNIYSDPTSYYETEGGHGGESYGGSFVKEGDLAGRVRIQVYRGPTVKSDYTHYAPWGYYVIQPSDSDTGHSYGY